jgi:hypothetical protein
MPPHGYDNNDGTFLHVPPSELKQMKATPLCYLVVLPLSVGDLISNLFFMSRHYFIFFLNSEFRLTPL